VFSFSSFFLSALPFFFFFSLILLFFFSLFFTSQAFLFSFSGAIFLPGLLFLARLAPFFLSLFLLHSFFLWCLARGGELAFFSFSSSRHFFSLGASLFAGGPLPLINFPYAFSFFSAFHKTLRSPFSAARGFFPFFSLSCFFSRRIWNYLSFCFFPFC